MEATAPSLREVQRAVRASLLARDGGAVAHILGSGFSAAERLEVYRNTFASVLVNALRLSFPAVHKLVGAEFFAGAARIFAADHPPMSACLDDYGIEFAEFLAHFAPAASLPYLPDVARLEWAVTRALHAEDADPLEGRRLAAIPEADRALVRFAPHPAVGLVSAQTPVDQIWRSVLDENDAALAAIDLGEGAVWLLVERLESGVEVTRMSEAAWRFTKRLCSGEPLHSVLALAQDVRAPALLAEHLAAGRFVDFTLSGIQCP